MVLHLHPKFYIFTPCSEKQEMPGLSDLVPEGHRVVPTSNVAELAQNAVQNALELGLPCGFQGWLVGWLLL